MLYGPMIEGWQKDFTVHELPLNSDMKCWTDEFQLTLSIGNYQKKLVDSS